MNFQNLEYFLAVAREGNITHAAEKLGISQQALSNQIARLEDELGCQLFNRKHGFELTLSGKTLEGSANRILDINKQTETVINDINENRRGELKIGISHTRGQAILPLVLPEFKEMYPQVRVSLLEVPTKYLDEHLEKGDIDIMIGYKPFLLETAEVVDLMKEHLFLVASREVLEKYWGSEWEKNAEGYKAKPDLKMLEDLPFVLLNKGERIRNMVDSEFSHAGISPNVILETGNMQTSFSLAVAGIGIAIMPELYLSSPYLTSGDESSINREKVSILPFTSPASTLAIGYNSDRYLSRMAQDFIKLATKKFASL